MDDRTDPQGGPTFRQVLSRRLWLILMAVLCGLGLSYLYSSRQPPEYVSTARLLLEQRSAELPGREARTTDSGQNAMNDQLLLLRSPEMIRAAVARGSWRYNAVSRLADPEQAVSVVSAGLSVYNPDRTSSIDISFRGSDPAETQAVVADLLAAYRQSLSEAQQDNSEEAVQLITQAKDRLLTDLESAEAEYRRFREEAPLAWIGGEGANMHEARLEKIEGARADAALRLTETQGELDAIRDSSARGGNRLALTMMAERAARRQSEGLAASPTAAADTLFPMILELEQLNESLGRDHPKVRALTRQIEMTRSHLNGPRGAKAGQPVDLLAAYVESLEQQMAVDRERRARLDTLFETEQKSARALLNQEQENDRLRKNIDRLDALFEATVGRLKELSLARGFERVRVKVLAPPGLGSIARLSLVRHLTLGGLLGAVAGIGLGYMLEVADRGFEGPEDVRNELGVPVVGHIPAFPIAELRAKAGDSPLNPTLVTAHQPRSQLSEAIRVVRASIFSRAGGAGGFRVLLVTSPDVGDGKSTVSSNLAITIAQSGRRVLLIDADVRRPRQAKLFGLADNGPGLGAAVRGDSDPADAIVPAGVNGLWLLPCADSDVGCEELIAGERFDHLLQVLREQYDFIIVDSPPLLLVSDTALLAPRADGVLMAIRLGKHSRAKAIHAADILRHVGSTLVGVVVNRVSRGDYRGDYDSTGSQYYHQYDYRYGSRYGGAYSAADAKPEPAAFTREIASASGGPVPSPLPEYTARTNGRTV